jgi:flavin reductase (DIM6/NTAB) family NADH-FMN oxidoreductase RutF
VAIFSSVTHLGVILPWLVYHAPTTVPRDTYKNIKETGYFTINHITAAMISSASSDQLWTGH